MQIDFLDRSSGVPVYRQLAEYLKKQISFGIYKPGDVLPSEAEIIRDFNISRTTVRLAFGLISNAGLIRREQGRGTIVVSQVRSKLPLLSSFTEEVAKFGRQPGTRFLSKNEEYLPLEAANALKLNINQKCVKIVRLRMADDQPLGLAVSWLNIAHYPQLEKINGTELSLYDVFENQLGLKIRSAVENIRADIAGEFESHNLNVKSGSPILRLTRTTFVQSESENGTPIEYVEVAFNGFVYSVDIELFRQGN
jgi:GntR family transcriptional regulator